MTVEQIQEPAIEKGEDLLPNFSEEQILGFIEFLKALPSCKEKEGASA